jgi:amino acid transporter
MEKETTALLPAQERQSIKRHRRQVGIQVWLPLGAGILVFLALGAGVIYTGVTGSDNLYRFTDLSIIYMIIPTALICLVGLVVLGALIFLTTRVRRHLPDYTLLGQAYANSISVTARVWSDKIVRPVIALRKATTGARAARDAFKRQG